MKKSSLFFVGIALILMSFTWNPGLNFKKPVKGKLVSTFGMRLHPVTKIEKLHKGIDYKAKIGTPVYAAEAGIIKNRTKRSTGYGNNIIIKHKGAFSTRYAHLSRFAVKQGARVRKGQLIGYVGNTGASKSPHLHFEILKKGKAVNPKPFL